MPHAGTLFRNDSPAAAKMPAYQGWFERMLAARFEPLLDKKLIIGQHIKTDYMKGSDSIPVDVVTTVHTWGFVASSDEIFEMEARLQRGADVYFMDDAYPVTVKITLIYLGPSRPE
jgi:hypothetical protein